MSGADASSHTTAYSFSDVSIPSIYLTSNFKFRLRWVTNGTDNAHLGCFVDTIRINKFSDGTREDYVSMQGTSMAAPHVAGLAALLWGYNPSLTVAQVKDIILTKGDAVAALTGKTTTGKRINAYNALQSINTAKAITNFSFTNPNTTGTINESDHTIQLTVHDMSITALTPTITHTGTSISPASGVVQDFTSPVVYTVTAGDGSTQVYTVTVSQVMLTDTITREI